MVYSAENQNAFLPSEAEFAFSVESFDSESPIFNPMCRLVRKPFCVLVHYEKRTLFKHVVTTAKICAGRDRGRQGEKVPDRLSSGHGEVSTDR